MGILLKAWQEQGRISWDMGKITAADDVGRHKENSDCQVVINKKHERADCPLVPGERGV